MREETLSRVAEILRGLRGVTAVASLDGEQRARLAELESGTERMSLPVRNLGVALMTRRDACFVLLKTPTFRPPKAPSVYLVEDDPPGRGSHDGRFLTVEGKRYWIIGEEVTGGLEKYSEPVIPLEESFVIFPERRSGARVPCFFLLPPLPFPELERLSAGLEVRDVISISPSLACDGWLRQVFGFPLSNDLATLLVGLDALTP